MRPKCVVWDWNGTLLDDTLLCFEIANEMRKARGLGVLSDIDVYREIMGFPIVDYYRRMGYTFENETYDAVSDEFVFMYIQRCNACMLQPKAPDVLAFLSAHGIRQALLSATGQKRLDEQVALYPAILPYLTDIIGMPDDLAHSKAALAQDFMARESLPPADVLFIGDTDHDFEVAASVGSRAILISNGHQSAGKLHATSTPVLAQLSEVPAYITALGYDTHSI